MGDFNFTCPPGTYINQFNITAGDAVNAIQAQCSDGTTVSKKFFNPASGQGTEHPFQSATGFRTMAYSQSHNWIGRIDTPVGGNGNANFQRQFYQYYNFACPANALVNGFSGTSTNSNTSAGNLLSQIGFTCAVMPSSSSSIFEKYEWLK